MVKLITIVLNMMAPIWCPNLKHHFGVIKTQQYTTKMYFNCQMKTLLILILVPRHPMVVKTIIWSRLLIIFLILKKGRLWIRSRFSISSSNKIRKQFFSNYFFLMNLPMLPTLKSQGSPSPQICYWTNMLNILTSNWALQSV